MSFADKFFEVLLVDGAIMYNVYNNTTGILDITYKDTTYICDLSSISVSFPDRRRYTLQTFGLYLFACQILQLNGEITYDVVAGNYLTIKQINTSQKTDLTSLLLISIPSFLLPVISHTTVPLQKLSDTASGWKPPPNLSSSSVSGHSSSSGSMIITVLAVIIVILLLGILYRKKN